jgi:type I restriction enzyme S subunit
LEYGYTEKASFDSVGPKFLRITDIQDDAVEWSTVPTCPVSDKDLHKYRLKHGDIVFARTGATTGKSYLVDEPPDAVAASYLIRCRLRLPGFHAAFLAWYFKSKEYWRCISAGITGSAQGGFNASKLADLVIPFPSLAEQIKLADSLAGIESKSRELRALYEAKATLIERFNREILRNSLPGASGGFAGLTRRQAAE